MIVAAQYAIVDHGGYIDKTFSPTEVGLRRAWLWHDASFSPQGVVIVGANGITPINRDGSTRDEPIVPARPGVVIDEKTRAL